MYKWIFVSIRPFNLDVGPEVERGFECWLRREDLSETSRSVIWLKAGCVDLFLIDLGLDVESPVDLVGKSFESDQPSLYGAIVSFLNIK